MDFQWILMTKRALHPSQSSYPVIEGGASLSYTLSILKSTHGTPSHYFPHERHRCCKQQQQRGAVFFFLPLLGFRPKNDRRIRTQRGLGGVFKEKRLMIRTSAPFASWILQRQLTEMKEAAVTAMRHVGELADLVLSRPSAIRP